MDETTDFAYTRVTAAAQNTKTVYSLSRTIPRGGFMYIYLSNESTDNMEVYFDELEITHTKGKILQEDHYYPFGMNISALSSSAPLSKPNDFNTFQGQERTEDFGLHWTQFKWRNHDPQIGRFFNIDPLADKYVYNSPYAFSENRVVDGVELEGLEYMHYTVIMDANGKFKHRELTNDYRGQINFDYEEYSESFGPRGRGILYTTYEEDANGNLIFKSEKMVHAQDSWRNRMERHGIYTGAGSITLKGPEFDTKTQPNNRYDFTQRPIDMVDAMARLHDMEQAVKGFKSFTEIKWIFSDIRLLNRLTAYRGALADGRITTDPYTGRAPSNESRRTMNRAITFFSLEIGRKKARMAWLHVTGQVSFEDYMSFLNEVSLVSQEPVTFPKPDATQSNSNGGGN